MLTAAHESHQGEYPKQVHEPALGIYQVEPTTAYELFKNYLWRKPDMELKLYELRPEIHSQLLLLLATELLQHSPTFVTAYVVSQEAA